MVTKIYDHIDLKNRDGLTGRSINKIVRAAITPPAKSIRTLKSEKNHIFYTILNINRCYKICIYNLKSLYFLNT